MAFYQLKKEEKRVTYEYTEAKDVKEAEEKFKYGNVIETVQQEIVSNGEVKVEEVQVDLEKLKEPTKKLRIVPLSDCIAKNKTTKDSYVLVEQKVDKLKIGDIIGYNKDYYEVFAITKEEVFLKNEQKKEVINKKELVGFLQPIREYIKKNKPYECLITFKTNDMLVKRLTEFDEDVLEIMKKANDGFTELDAEEYWIGLTEKSTKDIQEKNTYSIVRNFSEEELTELKKLNKYNIQVLNILWKDLKSATKYVIESCFDFEDKPRAIEIALGDVLQYNSRLYGKLEFEITEDVLSEVKKYADYTNKIEIKEMLNSVLVSGVKL